MKKLFAATALVIMFSGFAFADLTNRADFVQIINVDPKGGVQIKEPGYDFVTYKDTATIPYVLYGSKIIAGSKPVQIIFYQMAVMELDKNQGVVIAKDPVADQIQVSKLQTPSENNRIKIDLCDGKTAYFGGDSIIGLSLNEKSQSMFLSVLQGGLKIFSGISYISDYSIGDVYEAKQDMSITGN